MGKAGKKVISPIKRAAQMVRRRPDSTAAPRTALIRAVCLPLQVHNAGGTMSADEAYAVAFAGRADDRPKAATLQAIRRVARQLGSKHSPPGGAARAPAASSASARGGQQQKRKGAPAPVWLTDYA